MVHFLHELINTLTSGEKRYFKLTRFGASKTKRGIQKEGVFEEKKTKMDYLEVYDFYENGSQEKSSFLAKHDELNPSHFSVVKGYLYKLLLKSLRDFYEASSKERMVMNLIFDAKILKKKHLANQAIHLLTQAEKLAQTYEFHYLIPEILTLRMDIVIVPKYNFSIEEQHEIQQRNEEVLRKINTKKNIRFFYRRGYFLFGKKEIYKTQFEELRINFEKTYPEEQFENLPSINSKLDALALRGLFAQKDKDNERRGVLLDKVFKLYKENPSFRTEYYDRYLRAVNNFITHCIHVGTEESIDNLKKISNLLNSKYAPSKIQKTRAEDYQIYGKLMRAMHEKDWMKVVLISNKSKNLDIIKKLNSKRQLMYYFNFGVGCLLSGNHNLNENHRLTELWIKKIKNTKPKGLRKEVRKRAQLLRVLVDFSKKDFEKAEKTCDSAIRAIKKVEPVDADIIHIIKKLKLMAKKKHLDISTINDLKSQMPRFNEFEELKYWFEKFA